MAIGADQVAPGLQDLGVVLVELNETRATAGVLRGSDRRSKCRVCLVVATLLGEHDSTQAVRLRLGGGLVEAHGEVEGPLCRHERGLEATLLALELGQAAAD